MKPLFFVLFMALALSSCMEKKMEAPPKFKPRPAEQFTLTNIKGANVSLSDYKGKSIIINFWATWCVPCIKEMPMIDRFYRAKKNDGLEVLMINIKESKSIVTNFIERNGYSFQVLLDKSGEVSEKFQVFGLPSTYFIDRQGIIQNSHMGGLTKEILYNGYESIKIK